MRRLELNDATYRKVVASTENILRRLLVTKRYDSISNFLDLYEEYKRSGCGSLRDLYERYEATTRPQALGDTCVGLALELMRRWQCLESRFPGLRAATCLMSCEETVPYVCYDSEVCAGPFDLLAPDKEHVMVGVHITLNGRLGILIADPGYHVARTITVMVDQQSPHTGWFNHITEPEQIKDYSYSFCEGSLSYVLWKEVINREGKYKYTTSLIYVGRPYCGGITVTEKRNLVYKLKSLVHRAHNGVSIAGLYVFLNTPFRDAKINLFYYSKKAKIKKKYNLRKFQDIASVEENILKKINICNARMELPGGKLLTIINKLAKALSDESFTNQCNEINTYIIQCSI
ncbi:uncharacterized protein LOC135116566 isoform X1 [Helicoverpa armigera]|uniref:uncharacterized protein LOC135116566 isoform X1 n=1 Tax=Helicoverpa armigera TaxID=29058 RepID=UPI003083917B